MMNSQQHLLAEMERIDLLIRLQVVRARQIHDWDDRFLGLHIPEEEVDAILAAPRIGLPRWAVDTASLDEQQIRAHLAKLSTEIATAKAISIELGRRLRLVELAERFQLTPFDVDVLLIVLAQELDLRYERLYGYLQDHVNKKRPTVDLALNLLCPSLTEKLARRVHFSAESPLLKQHLIHLLDDPTQPHLPLFAKPIKLDERVVGYLLEQDALDQRVSTYLQPVVVYPIVDDLFTTHATKQRLRQVAQAIQGYTGNLLLALVGTGSDEEQIAAALCQQLERSLLLVDSAQLLADETGDFSLQLTLIEREASLQNAAILWGAAHLFLTDTHRPKGERWLQYLRQHRGMTLIATPTPMTEAAISNLPMMQIDLPMPNADERCQLWQQRLQDKKNDLDLCLLAQHFCLNSKQIAQAADRAWSLACGRDLVDPKLTPDDLYTACQGQHHSELSKLARKLTPLYRWPDLILPADAISQLEEICQRLTYRHQVFEQWGFRHKLSRGKGINVLFAGASGTGKSMAAEVIANALGLELYQIDLSRLVSKYIGETEKNLDRIFTAATHSNAILLFDEADALFGKRSEVHDAHDRYANIEISYLLQKMEEYEGLSILTSNLAHNLDGAFVRRLAFTIHFPFPDEAGRLQLWQKVWPPETLCSNDLDFERLSHQFKLSGGNIKNIALAAAFLAAADGERVTMRHLLHGVRREFQKMGKVLSESEIISS